MDKEPTQGLQFTTSSDDSWMCHNPLCHNAVPPIGLGWRRTERLYCSDICKQTAWILKQAREALASFTDQEVIDIIRRESPPKQTEPATVTPLRKKKVIRG